ERLRIEMEDVLKALYKTSFDKPATVGNIQTALAFGPGKIRMLIRRLRQHNLVSFDTISGPIELTIQGRETANHLVRAHRLWESYLYTEMGMHSDHIHEEAEHLEHVLTADQINEVDRRLGFPSIDPHGSPIPSGETLPVTALRHLLADANGKIARRQPGVEISHKLWDLGLGPGDLFTVVENGDQVIIRVQDRDIVLSAELAEMVSVETDQESA